MAGSSVSYAWTNDAGQVCSSSIGSRYKGSDGGYYNLPDNQPYLVYDENGNTYIGGTTGNARPRYKLMMTDGNGETQQAYCIEVEAEFTSGTDNYTSSNGENNRYFQNLPTVARHGIMYAALYGWQPGKALPIDGINEDDFSYATQCIIWEYQQQIRTSPWDLHDNNGVSGSLYYSTLAGRPAERAYNWILDQMSAHGVIPSFTSTSENGADVYTMKYDASTGKYSLTLTDTNGVDPDLKFTDTHGIAVSRNGNQYTFTSDHMIETPVTLATQKDLVLYGTGMLIWGRPGHQTMMTGVQDPLKFFIKLQTETSGTCRIVKTSEDGIVSGISFTISGNGIQKTVTTGSDGNADISGLAPGTYEVTEKTTDRYEPQSMQRVVIVPGKTSTVTFSNTLRRGSLRVTKTSEDGLVESIRFHLYGVSLTGAAVDEYAVTDANGVAVFEDILISGDKPYTLEEVDTPTRYEVPAAQSVAIEWNKVTNKSVSNVLKRGGLRVTKTSEDGLVEGMRFHLYGTSLAGVAVDEYAVTDANGVALFENILISGSSPYMLEETGTPARYIVPDVQDTVIEWNKVTEKYVSNVLKRGSLRVTKTSEDGLAEGMRFHLYGTSLAGFPVDEYAVTDANGVAVFSDILISGSQPYVLEEVDTPVRYVIPKAQNVVVEWNKVTDKSITNILKKWRVIVTKSDQDTGAAQGDASLAGAVYGIYKGETLIDTYHTDGNGQFTSSYYVCGDDWSVREITPSEGYLLDEATHHVGAEPEQYTIEYNAAANDVTEQVIRGNISIIKHTDGGDTQIETPEAGAVFEVFLKTAGSYDSAKETERDILTCDENGFAQTKDMPYGVYTVRQASGWEGRELMKPFDVFIRSDGQTYRYLINNANFESYIRIVKTDAETGNTIPYAGAAFQIYAPDGELVTMAFTYPELTTIDTFYTTEEGCLITPQKLPYGTSYSIVEVQAPYGYVLDPQPVFFDVAPQNAGEEGGITLIEVTRPNMAQKGVIRVKKSGEVFASVTENDGIYQPVYAVQGLPGAVYEIRAAEDIYTPDGTLRFSVGKTVDTITTDEAGTAESIPLYLGKYEIRETQAPYGMILNDEIHAAELVYAGQEIEITETSTSFYNDRQKVLVTLEKTMETDAVFGIGASSEITAVTFGLYAGRDMAAADGSTIPADGLLEIVSVGSDGHAACRTDLPLGSYYLKEFSIDSHYILPDTSYPVVFEYNGQDTVLVEIAANDGIAIENTLKRGRVEGRKTDEDGTALAGAKIGLFDGGCEEFTEENAKLVTLSGDDGAFYFEDIPVGMWNVAEIESPEGFVLSGHIFPVEITEDGQVVTISMENTFIRGSIEVTKLDQADSAKKLSGAVFEVYSDSDRDGKLGEADILMGTMREYMDGIYRMDGLRYGAYLVRETTPPEGFLLNNNIFPAQVTEDGQTIFLEISDAPIRGNIQLTKCDQDNPEKKLSGAVFEVYEDIDRDGQLGEKDIFVGTMAETDSGVYRMDGLRFGSYLVREKQAPKGYVLTGQIYIATITEERKTIHLDAQNRIIQGNVELTKYDKDYPDHTLSGASFEVYADMDADGKLGDKDMLLGTMTEYTGGVYRMEGLAYGSYLIRETKAPDGFILDEKTYPVKITTDGETVNVENEAGKGFFNAMQRGTLRIRKRSEDGVLEGFVFQVSGADICGNPFWGQYTTNENGEIWISDLRIGTYTISEAADIPNKYVIPENQTVTIQANTISTAEFYNKLTDVPKTGDGSPLVPLVLSVIAATGIVSAYVVQAVKQKRKVKK